ncbi:MAG TPA: thioredoxin domain-containing protein [Streptomyces sp.]|nr:thioredoxin domain-containing protein [Streptomyces sp.]
MSKRNSQEAKRAARERLRIEREKQAKKEKIRRQVIVAGSVVAILGIAGGIGFAVANMEGDSSKSWSAAAEQKLVKPANATGENGTTVVLGDKDAKKTIDVYEDMRCPACANFEQVLGERLKKGADEGKYKLQFHFGGIIDGNFGGDGSKNATSALGAALNVSTEAFSEYHSLLYTAEYHPAENQDKFADNDYLLEVAGKVDALKGNEEFKTAVEKGTYDKWALEMIDGFNKSDVKGTPTVRIDGKDVETTQIPSELDKLGVK